MSFTKRNGRSNYRPINRINKRPNYHKSSHSFTNNRSRVKGSAPVLFEKYTKLAKESSSAGDRIQAEYYLQIADHYSRAMSENDMKSLDKNKTINSSNEKNPEDYKVDEEKNIVVSNAESASSENTSKDLNESDDEVEEKEDSIETVSFISKPATKVKRKK